LNTTSSHVIAAKTTTTSDRRGLVAITLGLKTVIDGLTGRLGAHKLRYQL